MPKTELDGMPVIEVPDSEEITVAVKVDGFDEGELNDPEQHPIAIALRRQSGIDDADLQTRGTDPTQKSVVQVGRAKASLVAATDSASQPFRQTQSMLQTSQPKTTYATPAPI